MGQMEQLAEQGLLDIPVPLAINNMISAIASAGQKVILMLDDFHRLGGGQVLDIIQMLINEAPDNFHILINSRIEPPISLPEMLAAGMAQVIDADNLRFSLDETRSAIGDESDVISEGIKVLYQKTEGWPVAVQLAKLAIGTNANDPGFSSMESDQDKRTCPHI